MAPSFVPRFVACVLLTLSFQTSFSLAQDVGPVTQPPSAVKPGDDRNQTLEASPPSSEAEQELAIDPPGYRDAVEHALSELRVGHFSEARAMFLHAHELLPNARTLRGLGLAEFELRSYVDSIQHLEQSLASTVRPLSAQLRAETESLLSRANRYVTRLELTVTPVSASVTIDGAALENVGQGPLLLAAGDHVLELSATGRVPQRRSLHALGGDTQRLTVLLAPLAAAQVARHEESRPLYKNPWFWLGVGALAAGAAVTGGVVAANRGGGERSQPYGGTSHFSFQGL